MIQKGDLVKMKSYLKSLETYYVQDSYKVSSLIGNPMNFVTYFGETIYLLVIDNKSYPVSDFILITSIFREDNE